MELTELRSYLINEFPILKKHTDRTLYFILKPFIVGLRIMKVADEYRVYFEIYPLWKNEVLARHGTLIFEELLDNNRGQIFINRRWNPNIFLDVIKNIKLQYGEIFCEQIHLKDFMTVVFAEWKQILKTHKDPYWQIPIFQILFGIALYYDNQKIKDYVTKLFNKNVERWKHLKYKSGGFYVSKKVKGEYRSCLIPDSIRTISYSESEIERMKQEIFHDFEDKEHFFAKIKENCKLPKIAKLNVGEFVGIDEFQPTESLWDKLRFVFKRNWE